MTDKTHAHFDDLHDWLIAGAMGRRLPEGYWLDPNQEIVARDGSSTVSWHIAYSFDRAETGTDLGADQPSADTHLTDGDAASWLAPISEGQDKSLDTGPNHGSVDNQHGGKAPPVEDDRDDPIVEIQQVTNGSATLGAKEASAGKSDNSVIQSATTATDALAGTKAHTILALAEAHGVDTKHPVVQSMLNADYDPNRVIIKWNTEAKTTSTDSVLAQSGAALVASTTHLGIDFLEIDRKVTSVEEFILSMVGDPRVAYVEPDYILGTADFESSATTPNDPRYGSLWGLNNTGEIGGRADADIDAPEAWDIATGSSSVVVGVIDTGVDFNHPDLNDNMWVNTGEIAGNGIDDDGNGYIDDIHGYDFVNNDGNPMDDNSHGTHVAGTIAAEGNNNLGVTGVNWDASIMALKFLSASGGGFTSNAIRAIEYATMMGADITNNSWGGGRFSQGLRDAITAADIAGSLFVAAAGNDSRNTDAIPSYPASYTNDNIISVASTDRSDNLSGFSNYGQNTVDIGAPGSSILSTMPNGSYGYKSGTSMATPHVAGVAALVKSIDPTLTDEELRDILLNAVDPVPSLSGRVATGGRINAQKAVESVGSTSGGEVGQITNLSEQVQTIQLDRTYTDPVVFVQPATTNGASPAFPRIVDVGSNSFSVMIDEPNALDGIHNAETVTYAVFEAGVYQLPDGGLIEIGSTTTNKLSTNGFETVRFSQAFDAAPVVLSQVQTVNGADFVVTRQQDISRNGFRVTMQEEEALNGGAHAIETVGWLAMTPGSGSLGAIHFEAGKDGGTVTNAPTLVPFVTDFTETPLIVGGLSTTNGSDPAWARLDSISAAGVTVRAEEDQTLDTETLHVNEAFDYVAFAGAGSFALRGASSDLGSITGVSWFDVDRDGIRDPGDYGVAGRRVFIDSNNNGAIDPGERVVETDANGSYTFGEVAPGTYKVAMEMSAGDVATIPSGSLNYTYRTSDDIGGPSYSWRDISSVGTRISLSDDSSARIPLPFDFDFFGSSHQSAWIGSNGLLNFNGSGLTDYANDRIPDSTPPDGFIAPFWDDLNPGRAGNIYYYNDAANDRMIFQYDNVPHFIRNVGNYTFQLILNDNNSFEFMYHDLNGNTTSATIGIEDPSGTNGIQLVYNSAFARDGLAVKFVPQAQALHNVTIGANENEVADFGFYATAAPVAIGETGSIAGLTHEKQTFSFSRSYENPVVLAQVINQKGGDPVVARVTDVSSNSFDVYLEEPNYLDGRHMAEQVSFVVFEAGTWSLSDGTILEVGSHLTDRLTSQGYDRIDLEGSFDGRPVILSQTQTDNGGDFVVTRQRNASQSGFELALQEEQALNSGAHARETVGWVAVEAGRGSAGDVELLRGDTGVAISDAYSSVPFTPGFSEAPLLFGTVASVHGQDTTWLQYRALSGSSVQMKLDEETSQDRETAHIQERVDFLAFSDEGTLYGTAVGADTLTNDILIS